MSFFDAIGKGISKGFDAGNHGFLGPVGGLFGAVGGGLQGLFGGQLTQHPLGLLGGQLLGQQDDDETDPIKRLQKQQLMQKLMQQGGGY